MKCTIEGHRFGDQVVPRPLLTEVQQSITRVAVRPSSGKAPEIRAAVLAGLTASGWSGEVELSIDSEITITSAKNRIGLCLQTGNVARIYADLLKLQKLYADGSIIAGIMIVPSAACARTIGSNLVNSTRLLKELKLFERVITTPLAIFTME